MARVFEFKRPEWLDKRPEKAPKIGDEHLGFNGRLAVLITKGVGNMWCAYVFTLLALVSLPAAVASHDPVVLVSWISQTFLQLVLLAVIMVGQDVQGRAADKRAELTFEDAAATLDHALQLEDHLQHQDQHLAEQDKTLSDMIQKLQSIINGLEQADTLEQV
jgi:hypothetical protein